MSRDHSKLLKACYLPTHTKQLHKTDGGNQSKFLECMLPSVYAHAAAHKTERDDQRVVNKIWKAINTGDN